MNVLAVYGSNYGQAEAVLQRVCNALEARGAEVRVFRGDQVPADLAVEDFDATVVAASIRVGRYQSYIRDFVKRHSTSLCARPSAFVSVNGSQEESTPEWRDQAKGYVEQFLEQTAWQPRWTATFAGALRYRRYDPLTRWIVKSINGRRGGATDTSREYEFTDWQAVDRFSDELADALMSQTRFAPAASGS